jgi:hypothetical protein
MSELTELFKKLKPNTLGEVFREITFIGEGLGCYENFEVRKDAVPWSEDEKKLFIVRSLWSDEGDQKTGEGYTFVEGNLQIEVFWCFNGDVTLIFVFMVKTGNFFVLL